VIGLLLLAACGGIDPPPDLLLISVDTLRADHLGAWGGAPTPNIDALAASGVRFSRALTVTNNTLPAHVSMLSGLHPQHSGVPRNGFKLPEKTTWLPQELAAQGYETAAFVSASALSGKLGLSRGFGTFDDTFDVREMDQQQRRGATTVDAALAWLGQPRDAPTFAWVHVFDPHYPYTPPDPPKSAYTGPADGSLEYLLKIWGRGVPKIPTTAADRARMVELYDAEISYLDRELGRLIAGADDDDLIVLTADHGESLTEHDYLFDHGRLLYQPSLHVPLIVRPPRSWGVSPAVRDAPAQIIDVASTMRAAAGLTASGDGVDLGPLLRDGAAPLRAVAFAESCRPWNIEKKHKGVYRNRYKAQTAVRWPWKLIATPFADEVELYHLERDPGELDDRAAAEPAMVAELVTALEEWRGGSLRLGESDAENMERIKALGYIE